MSHIAYTPPQPGHHRRVTKPTSFSFRDAVRKAVAEGREFSIHDVQGLPRPVVYAIVLETRPEISDELHMRMAEKHGGLLPVRGMAEPRSVGEAMNAITGQYAAARLVDQAFRDILAGRFESNAIQAVLKGRAGSIHEYRELREQIATVERIRRHCGAGDSDVVLRRGHVLYPTSARLAHKWAVAKIRLGDRSPRVVIGSDFQVTRYRTPRRLDV